MKKNSNLHNAKASKNDEFYTMYEDIEKEVYFYAEQLRGKIVYCNCDTIDSNFVKYFQDNYEKLGLKWFYHTSDDFRSEQSISLLKQADVVITNPPFSLFREYIAQLMEYDKKFLIVGSMNAITYKEVFPLMKENKVWIGINSVKRFITPKKEIKKFGNIYWFTNIESNYKRPLLELTCKYKGNEYKYPKYDNYDAINVDKLKEIPIDYESEIGVPVTIMTKYNSEQFEIIGIDKDLIKEKTGISERGIINGEYKFARVVIRKKNRDN